MSRVKTPGYLEMEKKMNTQGTLEKENIEDIIALTPMQTGMLFHSISDPKSEYYFEQLSLNISGIICLHGCPN